MPVAFLLVGFGSFALWHLLPFGLGYLALRKIIGSRRAFISVCLGTVFVWTAVFLTDWIYGMFGNFTASNVSGVSGAPLIAFLYPMPSMGSDYAPVAMLIRFIFDYVFWIAIAASMSKGLVALGNKRHEKLSAYALALAVFGFLVVGFVHILLAFD